MLFLPPLFIGYNLKPVANKMFFGDFIPKLLLKILVLCLPSKAVIHFTAYHFHLVVAFSKDNYYLPNYVVSAVQWQGN